MRHTASPFSRIISKEVARDARLQIESFGANVFSRADQVHYERFFTACMDCDPRVPQVHASCQELHIAMGLSLIRLEQQRNSLH
jgi:hypothetical protein